MPHKIVGIEDWILKFYVQTAICPKYCKGFEGEIQTWLTMATDIEVCAQSQYLWGKMMVIVGYGEGHHKSLNC